MIYMILKKYHSRLYIWQECPFDSCVKKHYIIMFFCVRSRRLPRCARNDKVLRAEGNHIKKPTQDTLRQFKREPIKISIQFVCKLQSIIFLYTKVNRSIFSHHILLYLYLLKLTYYI